MSILGGPDIITDGLVSYLDAANRRCYPGSGTTLIDLSGNGNNATLVNAGGIVPTYTTESLGAIQGGNRYDSTQITRTSMLDFTPNSSFTLSIWAKVTYTESDNTTNTVFGRGSVGNSVGIGMTRDSSTAYRWVIGSRPSGNNAVATSIAYTLNSIECVALSYSPSVQYIYKNGELIATQTPTDVVGGSFDADNYNIFRNIPVVGGNDSFIGGSFYIAKIYNRMLSTAEVLQNYNATRSRFGL